MPFSGDSAQHFSQWCRDMDRAAHILAHDPERMHCLALQTLSGSAVEMAIRILKENSLIGWPDLKIKLAQRYSDKADREYARQRKDENIITFYENIIATAKEAFSEEDLDDKWVQQSLVQVFTDGIKHNSIARKLIKHSPKTLIEALDIAQKVYQHERSYYLRRGEVSIEVDEVQSKDSEILHYILDKLHNIEIRLGTDATCRRGHWRTTEPMQHASLGPADQARMDAPHEHPRELRCCGYRGINHIWDCASYGVNRGETPRNLETHTTRPKRRRVRKHKKKEPTKQETQRSWVQGPGHHRMIPGDATAVWPVTTTHTTASTSWPRFREPTSQGEPLVGASDSRLHSGAQDGYMKACVKEWSDLPDVLTMGEPLTSPKDTTGYEDPTEDPSRQGYATDPRGGASEPRLESGAQDGYMKACVKEWSNLPDALTMGEPMSSPMDTKEYEDPTEDPSRQGYATDPRGGASDPRLESGAQGGYMKACVEKKSEVDALHTGEPTTNLLDPGGHKDPVEDPLDLRDTLRPVGIGRPGGRPNGPTKQHRLA